MFGSNNYRSDRPRGGRSYFRGNNRDRYSNSRGRNDRYPPYAQRDNYDQNRWRDNDRGDRGYGGGRGGGYRYDDNRGGGGGGRYGGDDRRYSRHDNHDRGRYDDYQGKRGKSNYGRNYGGGYGSRGRSGGRHYSNDRYDNRNRRKDNRDGQWRNDRDGQRGRGPQMPEDLEWLINIQGHSKCITSIAFDENSGKMFTASEDGNVIVWSAESGECEHTVKYDGEVNVVLLAGGYLFVGACGFSSTSGGDVPGNIHVYNLAKNSEQKFVGHAGNVVCLHVVKDLLFSGGEDFMVKAWKYNTTTELFDAAGSLGVEQGGHSASVQCLASYNNFLFSADRKGDVRVWNLDTGTLAQKLDNAHRRSIMSMICWQGVLITGSMDGSICVWNQDANQAGGGVLQPNPSYTHQGDLDNGVAVGILSMCGTPDGKGNPILLAGMTSRSIVLYNLPSFEVRGTLPGIDGCKAIAVAPGGYVFVGDTHGVVRVFSWAEDGNNAASGGRDATVMES